MNKEEVMQEYLDGGSVTRMAKDRGVSREAIYLVLRKINGWQQLKFQSTKEMMDDYTERATMALQDVLAGMSIKDAAKKNNISNSTLYRRYPELRGRNAAKSQEKTEQIAEDWFAGMSYTNLCKKYGMHLSNVQRRLRRFYSNNWEEAKRERRK